jgi:hypothetical protein
MSEEYRKEYYKKNKDRILKRLQEPVTCDVCGGKSFSKCNYRQHIKSNKHILNVEKAKAKNQCEKLDRECILNTICDLEKKIADISVTISNLKSLIE